ncbi:MAG TPA: hypothetical protein VFX86_01820 [Candidatus Saccharimonadales bacterium]|nr:hypothetical protein [Candidatus Saccharimonadales bacterium]
MPVGEIDSGLYKEELALYDGPFIAERLADFDESNAEADIAYLQEVLDSFGNLKVVKPHITVLTRTDTLLTHAMHTPGRNYLATRDLVNEAIAHFEFPESRACSTAEADVFPQHDSNYFIGFNLDTAGQKITRREASKLRNRLGIPNENKYSGAHLSLARTDDPLYARYIANNINNSLRRPLALNLGELALSEPLGFMVERGVPYGLPAEADFASVLEGAFGNRVIPVKRPGSSLITAGEGNHMLDETSQRFDRIRKPLGQAMWSLPRMMAAQVIGTDTFEAQRKGEDVDVVALKLGKHYTDKAEEQRARLLGATGYEPADDDDSPVSRVGVAVVMDKSTMDRAKSLVERLIPEGKFIFLGNSVLRVFQDPAEFVA